MEGGRDRRGRPDGQPHCGKLAVDYDLARQAEVNTPQQFAESPALPKAFAKAVIEVRDETPLLVDDMLSDGGLFAELSKAYDYFGEADTLYSFS